MAHGAAQDGPRWQSCAHPAPKLAPEKHSKTSQSASARLTQVQNRFRPSAAYFIRRHKLIRSLHRSTPHHEHIYHRPTTSSDKAFQTKRSSPFTCLRLLQTSNRREGNLSRKRMPVLYICQPGPFGEPDLSHPPHPSNMFRSATCQGCHGRSSPVHRYRSVQLRCEIQPAKRFCG